MLTLNEVLGEDIVKEVTKEFLDTVKERNPEIAENIQNYAKIFAANPKVKAKLAKKIAEKTALLALSPLDGRYSAVSDQLREYFSEYALIKYRVEVEILWLERLLDEDVVKDPSLKERRRNFQDNYEYIMSIYEDFDVNNT